VGWPEALAASTARGLESGLSQARCPIERGKTVRKSFVLLSLVAAVFLVVAAGSLAAGGKLKCFTGSPATCVLNPSTSGATLNTTDGGYAGVYYTSSKAPGSALTSVSYSFTYTCQPSNVETVTCVAGGAPRWSIPIDTNGNSKTVEAYAFLDAANCGYTGNVSTSDPSCRVDLNTGGSWANWAAFAAANPTYRIGNALPFVIADVETGNPITLYEVAVSK
jgi:hypothetical protein